MRITGLDYLFWVMTFAEHLVLLALLLRIRKLPIFTCLIALSVLRTVVLFFLRGHGPVGSYFYTYWSLALIDIALQLAVSFELALGVFRPTGHWSSQTKNHILFWAGASVAVALSLSAIPKPQTNFWLQSVILRGSFCSAALASQLFVGMLVLSVKGGFAWSDQAAKIAKGFTLYSLASLLLETANTWFGLGGDGEIYNTLSKVRIVIYIGCAAYWIISLLPEALSGRQVPDQIKRQASAVSGAIGSRLETLRLEEPNE